MTEIFGVVDFAAAPYSAFGDAPGVEVEYCSLLVPARSAPVYEHHLQRKLVIHRE